MVLQASGFGVWGFKVEGVPNPELYPSHQVLALEETIPRTGLLTSCFTGHVVILGCDVQTQSQSCTTSPPLSQPLYCVPCQTSWQITYVYVNVCKWYCHAYVVCMHACKRTAGTMLQNAANHCLLPTAAYQCLGVPWERPALLRN